ncbi:hypothetical protein KIW84_022886 [Lathyrus oleraceus]|uniref:Uncharacterized protein n=1 Tax=Pisum sativum TaxID=3888 RepID=A0A9D5BBH3_PEA|nr:hypothetical protein KIW84_022886 [Pisum sativum]
MGLDSVNIRSFNDLGEAFVKQYKYNVDMAPDRDQLRAMSQKEKETFKDAPSDFTEMVNMGMRLEEGVREGCLTREEGSSAKLYEAFAKKKKGEAHVVENQHYQHQNQQQQHQQYQQQQHHPQQQAYQPQNNNQTSTSYDRKRVTFDPIPVTYAELYPSLIERKLITPHDPPVVPTNPQWWYKPELNCVYHSGAPGHDVENCYPLNTKVHDLVRSGILFFQDVGPNVKKNPLPEHGKAVTPR